MQSWREQLLERKWLSLNVEITFKKIGCIKITEIITSEIFV
jgi:hypothetical protein